ncbi:MAG: hypothetical protein QM647_05175 [Asticcacaulis sp.]|uniref:hypothetical protein n=1 Tax=Asticcacaulis sp. TaxID=1872648 RepID=UPI0039E3A81B
MINVFWLSLLLAGGELPSEAVTPLEFYTEIGSISTSRDELGPVGARMGVISILLGDTKLTDVSRAIGSGSVMQQGDAGDALRYLCYTLKGNGTSERLWLTSSELGGGEYINGLTLIAIKATPDTDRCPSIDRSTWVVTLDNGMTIGMDQDSLIQKLGEPSKRAGNFMAYRYYTVRVQKGVKYDADGRLNLHIAEGKLDGFSVDHTETN